MTTRAIDHDTSIGAPETTLEADGTVDQSRIAHIPYATRSGSMDGMAPDPTRAKTRTRLDGDRGASLVEFGIVAPLLLLLLFGVVEFGLLFGKKLDVSQGAREGARLAAVNYQATDGSTGATQTTEIVTATCQRMEVASSTVITIDTSAGTSVGDLITFTIESQAQPVTGAFDPWLSDRMITSEVDVRLEQPATFATTTKEACP